MRLRYIAPLIIVAFCAVDLPTRGSARDAPKPEITVAAAANLMEVAQRSARNSRRKPKSIRSSALHPRRQLTTQIENSAPFDVFLAADAEHPDKLDREDLLVPGSNAIYAVGVLALWIPPSSKAQVNKIDDLNARDVRVIALANPKLAPYGDGGCRNVTARWHLGSGAGQDRLCGKHQHGQTVWHIQECRRRVHRVFAGVETGRQGDPDRWASARADRAKAGNRGALPHQRQAAQAFTRFVLGRPGRAILARYGYKIH